MLTNSDPARWKRAPRREILLPPVAGVYALFLREGSILPGIEIPPNDLLYIGLAANRNGLAGRCHYRGSTASHSPRRSLVVLLLHHLNLETKLVGQNRIGLSSASERKLDQWMHDNLLLSFATAPDPAPIESRLITRFAPPLNLMGCISTEQHVSIRAKRSKLIKELQGREFSDPQVTEAPASKIWPANKSTEGFVSAEDLATEYGLSAKSLRGRLRKELRWYSKPMIWSFQAGSAQAADMISVAAKMSKP